MQLRIFRTRIQYIMPEYFIQNKLLTSVLLQMLNMRWDQDKWAINMLNLRCAS
jgi:hypothetical protein